MKLHKALKIAQINNCAIRRAHWTPNCYICKVVESKSGLCHKNENTGFVSDWFYAHLLYEGNNWEVVTDREFEQDCHSLEVLEVF